MSRTKTVCMIAYTEYSGDARVRREAETLASNPEYKVTVLVLKEKEASRTYSFEGVEVKELNISKYRGTSNRRYLTSYFKFTWLAFWAGNRLLLSRRLDIVHVHNMPNFLVFCAILPCLFGKRIVLDIHDTMIETYMAKYDGKISRILYIVLRLEEALSCAIAHKIICVNHVQRESLLNRGIPENKTLVLLNVPDPKIFGNRGTAESKPREDGIFKVVYHGTITKRLGVDLAIRAIAGLRERIPHLELNIIGSGEATEDFLELSQDLGLQQNICFSKPIPLNELVKTLETMDLGIVPNRKNIATDLMLPVKMLECMALGIPVVAPRLKTIQYYFSDDMVFYFEPDNIDSLIRSIFEAFSSEEKREKKTSEAMQFLRKYGWENHKYDLMNLYQTL